MLLYSMFGHMRKNLMSLSNQAPDTGKTSSDICPVTGLSIHSRPEWTDVSFGKDYRITASILGDSILYSQPLDYATRHDVENAVKLLNDIVTEAIPRDYPYVYIEDFTGLNGVPPDARKYYIEYMKNRKQLVGLIFCGVSPMLKMSIKLAKRLNIVNFNVEIVKGYSEAVGLALKMLSTLKTGIENSPANVTPHPSVVVSRRKPSPRVITNADWSLQLDGFSARFEIIDNDIFHVDTNGFLKEDQVEPLFKMQERVINLNPLPEGSYYFIGGVTEVKGSRKARSLYYDYMMKWYKDHPFRIYMFYGANRFLSAAINLASPFSPFPVRMFKGLDDTLDFIAKDKSDKIKPFSLSNDNGEISESLPSRQTEQYVEELLQFLGGINWEGDGYDDSHDVDSSHPFKSVFDAIALIKMDLDDLLQERNHAEAKRRGLEKKLRHSEKMEVIGTLAGGVAHDLNNVLSGLISYPELLLMDMPEDNPYREYILKIQQSGQKAAAIVQDLLTLARRGVAVTEVVTLDTILREYLNSPEYEKLISHHPGVQVETEFETCLLNILGSPVHLSKTVMNLCSNAAEAMPDGGKIFISTENRYVDRPIKGYDNVEEGDYVVLKVQDTGTGISPEDMGKIFEPFYTKKVMGRSGTGLGMAVVWGTVKDHEGYIDVKSSEGKGTTFTLYFPVTRKELTKDKSLVSIQDYMGRGESILVVDDVEEQREIASRFLKRLGYAVTSVSSGEESVKYLKTHTVNLVVLDMIMDPGIDGLDTYKQIIALQPGQKAMIASGFSETDRVKETQRLGAGTYVKKPYEMKKIGLAVKEELNK